MKVVSKTWPAGARFAKMEEENVVPRMFSFSALGTRNPKPSSGSAHVFATEADDNPRHGRMKNFIQDGEIGWLLRFDLNLGKLVGRCGEDNGGMGPLFFVPVDVHGDDPAVGGLPQAGDLGAKRDGIAKLGLKRVGENLEAFVKGEFFCLRLFHFGALLAFARAEDCSPQDRAVVVLEGLELGKSVADGEILGDSRVDAGHKGIDGVVEKFPAQSPHDKIGERLVFIVGFAANEGFAEEAKLGGNGKERRGDKAKWRQGKGP